MSRKPTRSRRHHEQGVAAILSMMFLVILGSLAASMAIVSQGNITTADSHLKINRALAASETGLRFMVYRLNQITRNIRTTDGLIDGDNAPELWTRTREALKASLEGETHNGENGEPLDSDGILSVGPIQLGPGQPTFTATFTPHPIAFENYNSPFYQRPPYSDQNPPVSEDAKLDATWIRVQVDASDGPINRTIQMDFRMEKKIRFAVLSKSRIMIGRNVMIEGPVGSRFMEVNLDNGHPVQMASDFRGINSDLDTKLDELINALEIKIVGTDTIGDVNGDNRINLSNPVEAAALASNPNPELLDANHDGYVDDYDYFVKEFDHLTPDGQVSAAELDTANNINTAQLLELIDLFGDPNRPGYGDGVINDHDRYAKIRGQVMIKANRDDWLAGAANGRYQDFFQGAIHPKHGEVPLEFQADDASVQQFEPANFDVGEFRDLATGDLNVQATAQATGSSAPDAPKMDLSKSHREEVPFGAAHPYDFYNRPVYENMTFTNVKIPEGTNALFKNCTFVGVTFVASNPNNTDDNFNFAGIAEADGTLKYPNISATVLDENGNPMVKQNTKEVSNNIRFDGCTFDGGIVSDAPSAYTHVRNKIAFTGRTRFDVENSALDHADKQKFKRSTILAPHYSVEMGSFTDPTSTTETVNLSGTIVAGVLDIRGQANINGTVLTTFEPKSGEGPVIGNTSPQFNTTLGYFPSAEGDLEAELPPTGVGVVRIRYDPNLALPNGIDGPIDITPVVASYTEGHNY